MPKRRSAPVSSARLKAHAPKTLERLLELARAHPVLRSKMTQVTTVEFNLVSQARMIEINAETRGKAEATDVLSFPVPPFFQVHGILGELVICEPVLRRQARERKHTPEAELDVLLVHGFLHLMGYDHEASENAAAQMQTLENELLVDLHPKTPGLIQRTNSASLKRK